MHNLCYLILYRITYVNTFSPPYHPNITHMGDEKIAIWVIDNQTFLLIGWYLVEKALIDGGALYAVSELSRKANQLEKRV